MHCTIKANMHDRMKKRKRKERNIGKTSEWKQKRTKN